MNKKLLKRLEEASPFQDGLEITPQRAFLLGNGDMTCLLMGNGEEFVVSFEGYSGMIYKTA